LQQFFLTNNAISLNPAIIAVVLKLTIIAAAFRPQIMQQPLKCPLLQFFQN